MLKPIDQNLFFPVAIIHRILLARPALPNQLRSCTSTMNHEISIYPWVVFNSGETFPTIHSYNTKKGFFFAALALLLSRKKTMAGFFMPRSSSSESRSLEKRFPSTFFRYRWAIILFSTLKHRRKFASWVHVNEEILQLFGISISSSGIESEGAET